MPGLSGLLGRRDFEELFPKRLGSPGWAAVTGIASAGEYYSYDNFIAAAAECAGLVYKARYRGGKFSAKASRVSVIDKATGRETLVAEGEAFAAAGARGLPDVTRTADLGDFLSEGGENDRRRELAAFLANACHETLGGEGSFEDRSSWGLFHNEEIGFEGGGKIGYVHAGRRGFPAAPGKSYHGRGPLQLKWNYNYGLASAFLLRDKNILLSEPERLTRCGKLGFAAAIWYWMAPKAPRPSCHDIMARKWAPEARDIVSGRTEPGFGMTIVALNGELEGNLTEGCDSRVAMRAGLYRKIAERLGADIRGEKLDTSGMYAWRQ